MIMLNRSAEAVVNNVLGISPQAVEFEVFVNALRSHLDDIDIDERDFSTLGRIKFIIDVAVALRERAKALGQPTLNRVARLQILAERKAGRWLLKFDHES